jgi:Terpene cyclase DEP1
MTTSQAATGLPTSSKVLCAVYGVIAIAALIATWSQNLAYFDRGADFLTAFWDDTKVNPASRSITVDIALFLLAAAILMVIEARKHDVKFVWAYIIGAFLIAISVTFPLFLIAREIRVSRADPTQLGTRDTIALSLLALFTAAFTIWVDVV